MQEQRVTIRQRVLRWWRESAWAVIGATAVSSLLLGAWGFQESLAAEGKSAPLPTLLYLSLQLFALEFGIPVEQVTWQLEISRFVAPVLAAYAAIRGALSLFSERVDRLWVGRMRNHVVICGLGEKGSRLANGFLRRGDDVVVIERDQATAAIGAHRDRGATVIVGDAADPATLRRASVGHAKIVVAITGSDSANAEVAVQTRALAVGRRRPVTCLVHVLSSRLYDQLRAREIGTEHVESFRLGLFNVARSAARDLLDERSVALPSERLAERRWVVAGSGAVGISIVIELARRWWPQYQRTGVRLPLTIIDREAAALLADLCSRFVRLKECCDVTPVDEDARSAALFPADSLTGPDPERPAVAALVSLGDDASTLSAALALRRRIPAPSVPIMLCLSGPGGLTSLLHSAGWEGRQFAGLHPYRLLDETCLPERVLDGTHELLARTILNVYIRLQERRGETARTNEAMKPWEELAEQYKDSNRQAADHIGVKLRRMGYCVEPRLDWAAKPFQFSDEAIDELAEFEHERYVTERRGSGWQYGPVRDPARKINPYLIPWDDLRLPKDIKDYDREFVRELPACLAEAGFDIRPC